jgi:hypothetical protein
MSHIIKAKEAAARPNTMHPAYGNQLLEGILHALLAIHEQNATQPRTPARKAADK